VRVPEATGNGKVKVTLSFADWKQGKVAPATFTIAAIDPNAKTQDKSP
jgi:hypothetical protein